MTGYFTNHFIEQIQVFVRGISLEKPSTSIIIVFSELIGQGVN